MTCSSTAPRELRRDGVVTLAAEIAVVEGQDAHLHTRDVDDMISFPVLAGREVGSRDATCSMTLKPTRRPNGQAAMIGGICFASCDPPWSASHVSLLG